MDKITNYSCNTARIIDLDHVSVPQLWPLVRFSQENKALSPKTTFTFPSMTSLYSLMPPYSGTNMSMQYFRFLLLNTNTWIILIQYFRFLLLITNTVHAYHLCNISDFPVEYKYMHTTNAIFQILLSSTKQYSTCILLMQYFRSSCWVQIHT